MKSLSSKTYQCGVTIQGLTTLSGTVYLTGITNTASWDHVIVGTTAQGQIYTRTYAQFMGDVATGISLSSYVPTSRTLSINGTSYNLSADRSWTITTPYVSKLQHAVKAGVAINKGQVVYVTSADGTNIIVGLASNASEATSSKTMGLLDATVSTNGFANVVTEGLLDGLDTSTAGAAGDPVWLGTGGNLIYGLASKPYAPAHLVFIGIVTRKNNSNGEIFVKVQNGFELKEIHDVDLFTTTPVNGHLLGFDGTLWVNKTIAGWLGYTPANASGTTNYLSKFTGSTTLGNSLVFDNGTNVGIGTVTPDSRLHIEGNTTGSGSGADAIVHIKQNGGWNGNEPWALYVEGYSYLNGFRVNAYDAQRGLYSDAGELGFAVGGNSPISFTQNTSDYRMYIAPGGNIGIGTTTPSYKLSVVTTGTGGFFLNTYNSTVGNPQIDLYDSTRSQETVISSTDGTTVGTYLASYSNHPLLFGTYAASTPTARMAILPSGNVGIGTTSPTHLLSLSRATQAAAYQLNINNDGGISDGNFTGIRFSQDSNAATELGNIKLHYYSTGATDLSFGTRYSPTALYIQSGGNVGIGTTNPQYKLDVNGSFNALTSGVYLTYNSGIIYHGSSYYQFPSGSYYLLYGRTGMGLIFGSNNAEVGRFDLSGNLGIGTTTPSYKLSVVTTGTGGFFLNTYNSTVGNPQIDLYDSTRSQETVISSTDGTTVGTYLASYSNHPLLFGTYAASTPTARMAILPSGNVGIGTTSPTHLLSLSRATQAAAYQLNINNDGGISDGNFTGIRFSQDSNAATELGNIKLHYYSTGATDLSFGTRYSPTALYIQSGGNVGIGTTNPQYKLDVNGSFNALTSGVYLTYNSGIIYHGSSYYQFPSGSYYLLYGRTGMGLIFGSNNAEVGRFDLSGNLGIGTTSPGAQLSIFDTNNSRAYQMSFGYTSTETFRLGNNNATGKFTFTQLNNNNGFRFTSSAPNATGIIFDINTSQFAVNGDTGNVGIGTGSPGAKLHVAGGEIRVDAGQAITLDVANTMYLVGASNQLRLYNGGNPVVNITTGGNVGIGTLSPSYKLDVSGQLRIDNAVANGSGQALIVGGSGDVTLSDGGSLFFGAYDYGGSTYLRGYDNGNILYFFVNGSNIAYLQNDRLYVAGTIFTNSHGNSSQWNTAYGWGNHASASYVPQARTLTINGTSYDLSANRSWTIATTTPGGSDTQVQYNSSGSLAGASALTYNSTTNRVGINQASPGYDLDVNGQVRVQDKLRVGNVNSGNGVVHMSSSATINPSATTIVWAQNVSVGMCAFIEYYILNSNSLTDQRAGTIIVTWNQSGTPTITHTETTTPDIGSTTTVNFTSSLVGSDARINAVNSSANPYTMVMSYKYF